MIHANGERYEGEWKDNKRHGKGVYYWPDGREEVGQYVNGNEEGIHIFKTAQGQKFKNKYESGK